MSILWRLLRSGKSDPAPPYRVVYIYFNDSEVVVVPTESYNGMHLPRKPFCRFARSVDCDVLGGSVIECMAVSEHDTKSDVFGRDLNEFFQYMGEVNWKTLESHWYHIQVFESSTAEYEIYEFQQCRGGGYASDRKPYRLSAASEAIGRGICDSMKVVNREQVDDGGPSHT